MIILGINEDHNATAALMRDGEIIGCASEERFSRRKNDTEYPYKSIESILQSTGVEKTDIDFVAFAGMHLDPVQLRMKRVTRYTISDYIREMNDHWKKVLLEKRPSSFWHDIMQEEKFKVGKDNYYDYSYMESEPEEKWSKHAKIAREEQVRNHIGIKAENVYHLDHHQCHSHYAYYASPHDKNVRAAVVTADGWGDGCNATISIVENGEKNEIKRVKLCNLARIYRWATLILGMKPNEHEFKVMGLAPYAKDYILKPVYDIYKETLAVDGLDFVWKNEPSDTYFYFKEKFEGLRFDGIAAGLQLWLEELLSEWIINIMQHTKANILYYSGGLAMNVKANKVLSELDSVDRLYVSPSGADESLAMGACYVLAKELNKDVSALSHVYLGSSPTVEEATNAVSGLGEGYTIIQNPKPEDIADLLAKGKVLGRCVGGMEFGARSLGNRAILCDPSSYSNIRLINEKIKFRDFWMPFTPSILEERADDYLVNPKGNHADVMTIAYDSTSLAQKHLKAAIHPYDFTVRPQVVSKRCNPDYYGIIKAFEKATTIGALLNTSLNLHGSPIVCTAEDAVDTLVRSGLDGLLLPGLLVLKFI